MRKTLIAGAALASPFLLQGCDVAPAPDARCATYELGGQAVESYTPAEYPLGNIAVSYEETGGGVGFGRYVTGLVTKQIDGSYTLFVPDLPTNNLGDILDPDSEKSIVLGLTSPDLGNLGITNGCIESDAISQAGIPGAEVRLPIAVH